MDEIDDDAVRPHELLYLPNNPDSITASSSLSYGKIYHNNDVVVDFIRGYMDPRIHIRRSGI